METHELIIWTLLTTLYFSIFSPSCLTSFYLSSFYSHFLTFASLRSIYDDQPNAHKRFMEKLDARIRNHDREIEKMCNFHHQGFVDAITELLKVRADAEKLMVGEIAVGPPTRKVDGGKLQSKLSVWALKSVVNPN